MPKHEFEFEVYPQGDYQVITIASGYDHAIYLSINHQTNWWVHLMRHVDGDYFLDIQVGNHNSVLLTVDRDGCRGVDEDRLEVRPTVRYRLNLLTQALGYVKDYETRIVYALEHLYQESLATKA